MIQTGSGHGHTTSNIGEPYLNCIEVLCEVIKIQLARIRELHDKERQLRIYSAALSTEMKLCVHIVVTLQMIRFDLGLDEFKGPVGDGSAPANSRRTKRNATSATKSRYPGYLDAQYHRTA
jgi:hypothetical protein